MGFYTPLVRTECNTRLKVGAHKMNTSVITLFWDTWITLIPTRSPVCEETWFK